MKKKNASSILALCTLLCGSVYAVDPDLTDL